jgi:hypothetical protein
VRNQVSHPYSTTGKGTVLFILIFSFFLYEMGRHKILDWIRASIPWFICFWFHHECHSDLCHSQVFEFCYILKRLSSYPYILALSWVLMTRHDHIRGCMQKFPYWIGNEINNNNNNNNNNNHSNNTRWEATQRVMAVKLTRLTHKIAIQLHLVAERCTICSSRSRWPVRKLLNTPLYLVFYTFISRPTSPAGLNSRAV